MSPDLIRALLADRSGIGPLLFFESVASTNTELRRLAAEGKCKAGAVLIAEQQTAGRGRQGRLWSSVPGRSLTFSLLVINPVPDKPAFLSVAAAAAVAAASEAVAAAPEAAAGEQTPAPLVLIKWPNDVFAGGAKVAGILIDAFVQAEEPLAVIGIGINVNAAPDVESRHSVPAGSLAAAAGRPLDRSRLLAGVLLRLDDSLTLLRTGRSDSLVADLQHRSLIVGRQARFERSGRVYTGRVRGHAADLSIILDTAQGAVSLPAEGTNLLEI